MKKILEFSNKQGTVRELWQVDDIAWKSPETRARYTMALMLSVSPKGKGNFDVFRAESMCRKLEKYAKRGRKPCAVCVAKCFFEDTTELYFYCTDKQVAHDLAVMARKKHLEVLSNVYGDPDWVIFKTELYPNAAQLQTIKNIGIIEMYKKRGDDLQSPRRVNHYCCFADEVSMLGYFEDARKGGFAMGDTYFTPEQKLAHSCSVRHISKIDKQTMDDATARVIAIAQKFGGEYVQWDCALMNARRY